MCCDTHRSCSSYGMMKIISFLCSPDLNHCQCLPKMELNLLTKSLFFLNFLCSSSKSSWTSCAHNLFSCHISRSHFFYFFFILYILQPKGKRGCSHFPFLNDLSSGKLWILKNKRKVFRAMKSQSLEGFMDLNKYELCIFFL